MIKKWYRKLRNLDEIDKLNTELSATNNKLLLEALKKSRIETNLVHVMNSTAKWRSLHASTTSEQFPNTIRIVFTKILNSPTELLKDFNKFTTSCCHNPNVPGGFTYR